MKQNSKTLDSFELSEEAIEIQKSLTDKIISEIDKQGGTIPFSQFIQMALYQPKRGYYQNGLHKFGDKGDFVTAPEIGRHFARCIANSIFQCINNKETQSILEIGAGSGALAVNLLKSLGKMSLYPAEYLILEPSAQLQVQQKFLLSESLPEYFPQIKWLSKLPDNFNGVIIANEVADAIPCERIKFTNNQWVRLGVSYQNSGLQVSDMDVISAEELPQSLTENRSEKFVEGYTTEYRPLIDGWIKSLANTLNQGAILLVDYGYPESEFYHPQRTSGSLNCFIRHYQQDDPLQLIGLQDITAHVDFSQIARVADLNGLDIDGYTTQAGFLLENGITEFFESDSNSRQETDETRYRTSQEIQKLLMPGQMGEVFKVILLTKKLSTEIKGFTLQDHLHRL